MRRFRILSLDGGGIRGTFTASVVANVEELTGKRFVDHFDLVTGTSTGGIIALGLGLGLPAHDVLQSYVERGPEIFPATGFGRLAHVLRHPFRHKYSPDSLQRWLLEVFSDRRLGESKCRLVIPAYDCNAGRVQLFKTAHHRRLVRDYRMRALDVAMATAAAPTYFPAFTAADGQTFLDGGLWANCPVVVALLEAVFVLGNSPQDIDILSIGTTDAPFDVSKRARHGGWFSHGLTWARLLAQAQIDGALAQAQLITGKRAMRVDATARPGRFSLDDTSKIAELRGLGAYHAKQAVDEIASRFLESPAVPFIPHYDASTIHALATDPAPRMQVARRRRRRSLGKARTGFSKAEYRVVDISSTGALLETDGALPVGNIVHIDLELDDSITIQVQGRIARVQHPAWGRSAGVGVQFMEFESSDAELAIERYVEADPATMAEA